MVQAFAQDSKEKGFSLIQILISIGIFGILALGISKMLVQGKQGAKSIEHDVLLNELRWTVSSRLDCKETLGINPSSTLPLNCSAYKNVTLKNKWGDPIAKNGWLGPYQVRGICIDNELVVGAIRTGKDPLRKDEYKNRKEAKDLFSGVSDFCREEFADSSPDQFDLDCADSYTIAKRVDIVGDPAVSESFGFGTREVEINTARGPKTVRRVWGITCKAPYRRMSCSIAGNKDGDIHYIDNGCMSDDEEWGNGSVIHINCCKK